MIFGDVSKDLEQIARDITLAEGHFGGRDGYLTKYRFRLVDAYRRRSARVRVNVAALKRLKRKLAEKEQAERLAHIEAADISFIYAAIPRLQAQYKKRPKIAGVPTDVETLIAALYTKGGTATAEALGITPDALHQRVSRTRKELKAIGVKVKSQGLP